MKLMPHRILFCLSLSLFMSDFTISITRLLFPRQMNIKGSSSSRHYRELAFICGRVTVSCRNYWICISLDAGYWQTPSRLFSEDIPNFFPRSLKSWEERLWCMDIPQPSKHAAPENGGHCPCEIISATSIYINTLPIKSTFFPRAYF